jgi:hypothetical protein
LQAHQLDGGQLFLCLECGHEAGVHGVSLLFLPVAVGAPFSYLLLSAGADAIRRGRDN